MPFYRYTAESHDGEPVSGTAEARSLPALAASLAAEGRVLKTARAAAPRPPELRGVPFQDVIAFYRQLAASLAAGLPVAETLETFSSECRNHSHKALLHYLRDQVSCGLQLSEAMAAVPRVFPEVHVATVRAGEESGRLETALDQLADQAEAISNLNRRFASSLVYPSVIALVALGLLGFSLVAIVPRFQALFGDLGITRFPALTGLVFFVAGKVVPISGLLVLGSVLLVVLISTQRRAAAGRLWLDAWKLRIPLLGLIIEKAALARFTGALGILLNAGVDLPRAVRIAAESAGNRTVERALQGAAVEVELGRELGDALGSMGSFPQSLAWRIGAAEEAGTLPGALREISGFYSAQVDSLITSLAGLLEPLLIIVVGSGVAMLVFGMFLPLVSMIHALTGGGW